MEFCCFYESWIFNGFRCSLAERDSNSLQCQWIMQKDFVPLVRISIYNILLTQDLRSVAYKMMLSSNLISVEHKFVIEPTKHIACHFRSWCVMKKFLST